LSSVIAQKSYKKCTDQPVGAELDC